jgi:hypothetical protein
MNIFQNFALYKTHIIFENVVQCRLIDSALTDRVKLPDMYTDQQVQLTDCQTDQQLVSQTDRQ